MSVRNQLTHYELEEFFCSLQDFILLSLNPSLSFDSAEFLSRRSLRKQPSFFAPGPSRVSRLFTTPRRFQKNSDRFVFKTTRFVLEEEEESAAQRNSAPLRSTSNKSSEILSLGRPGHGTPDLTTPTLAVESCSSSSACKEK